MRKAQKTKIIKYVKRSWVPVVFIILPLNCMLFAGSHEAFVRLCVLAVLFPLAAITICWYALSPKTRMIKAGGKLNNSKYSKKARIVVLVARVFFLLLGLGLAFYTFQLGRDVVSLLSGQETKIVRGYSVINSTPFGAWFASQSIYLNDEQGSQESYILFYSPKPRIKLDRYYEFEILPHTKLILQARELRDN